MARPGHRSFECTTTLLRCIIFSDHMSELGQVQTNAPQQMALGSIGEWAASLDLARSLATGPAVGSPDQRGRSRMRRREFIAGLGSTAAWPVVVQAQRAALSIIGVVSLGSANTISDVTDTSSGDLGTAHSLD
jgi:hypothetical protein